MNSLPRTSGAGQSLHTQNITVIRITPNNHPGNVKAFATVQIGDILKIHGVKIVQQPNQRAYVRLPDTPSNGRYWPVIECLDTTLQEQITKAVLNAWEAQR